MVPQTTPRETLYIETGLLDPQTISYKQKIIMNERLKEGNNSRMKQITRENQNSLWEKRYEHIKKEIELKMMTQLEKEI